MFPVYKDSRTIKKMIYQSLKIFIWKKNKEKRHIAKIFKLIARLPKMNEIGKRQNIRLTNNL